MTLDEIYRAALRQTGGAMGDGYGQSLPFLRRDGDTVRAAIVLHPISVRVPEGKLVYQPTHLATFDVDDGDLVELRAITREELGVEPSTWPVPVRMPAGYTPDSFLTDRARLFALLDAVLPAFARNEERPSSEVASAATEIAKLVRALGDPPVRPWVEAAGRELFSWLRRVAR